jgi:META domain
MIASIGNTHFVFWLALTSIGRLCLGLEYDGGLYILKSHADADGKAVPLPEGQFELKVVPDTTVTVQGENVYQFMFKFGNLMSAYASLLPTGLVFTDVASTKMLPPPEVNQLEMDLKDILDSATELTISTTVLTLYGETGSMGFASVVPSLSEQETEPPTVTNTETEPPTVTLPPTDTLPPSETLPPTDTLPPIETLPPNRHVRRTKQLRQQ